MAQDWLSDVRKYVADADEAVVDKIVKYLGIALQNRDSSLVSFSDKTETDRVRENFLKKKLALTLPDAELDEAIAHVGARMKEDRTKNRVTVYYLLAEHFGLLSLFGGAAGTAAAAAAAATAAAATMAVGAQEAPAPEPVAAPVAEPVRLVSEAPASYDNHDSGSGGGLGWLKWLLLALLLLLLLFLAMRYCAPHDNGAATDTTQVAANGASTVATEDQAGAGTSTTTTSETAPVPQGSGVVASEVSGKPKLTVYFDSGKTEVSNDLAAAAANVKAYLDKNPGSKLSVSGFNDPTGNAAINAEVSKKRAQGVKAALEKVGISPDAIELVKPADTTDTSADATAARRVEVTIK